MIAGASLVFLLLGGVAEDRAAAPLIGRPDLADGFESLPRLAGDTGAARQFEHLTGALDATGAAQRDHCFAEAPASSQWSRSVSVPMAGPKFASLVIRDDTSCGDAQTRITEMRMTYDLRTGDTIDWPDVLPADLIEPRDPADTLEFLYEATVRSKALVAWHTDHVLDTMDAQTRLDCKDRIAELAISNGLHIWLDAQRGGLAMAPALLRQDTSTCGQSSVMPTDELRRKGVSAELADAIDAAHRDLGWAAHASELPR